MSELGPCVEWTGARNAQGYGRRWYKGAGWRAHRAEWDEKIGPIPDGMDVLHHCDNPPCREITHLFLGTDQINASDKVAKGRQIKGPAVHTAKLTAAQVAEIRKRWRGAYRAPYQRELAVEFGVGRDQISRIVNYRSRRDT